MRWMVGALVAIGLQAVSTTASAAVVTVTTTQALKDAVAAAQPGTVIEMAPGTYTIVGSLRTAAAGTKAQPITLRAASTGPARIDFSDTQEGIVVGHADWILEHLWVNGVCAGGCGGGAAGIHVKATADRVVVRQSRITNWGENIKSDRDGASEPSDGLLIGNEISNEGADIASGGTGIDLVGGLRWRIVGNYVHDFARNETHYGIFVKGGARDAVIERNLVIGAKVLPPGTGAAVGISFGGGGTGAQFCNPNNVGGGGCACETFDGIARNNIVLNTTDAGLHTKRACGSVFAHDTVYNTGLGLQIQNVGAGAPVVLRNSVLGKGITGTATSEGNLLNVDDATWKKLFVDPGAADFTEGADASAIRDKGAALPAVTDDYFGAARQGMTDLGAIELPTKGKVWPWNEAPGGSGNGAPDGGGATVPPGGSQPGTPGGPGDPGGANPADAGEGTSASSDSGCAFAPSSRAGGILAGASAILFGLVAAGRRRRRR